MLMSVEYHLTDNEQTEVETQKLSSKNITISIGEVTFFCTREQAILIGNKIVSQVTRLQEPTAEEIAAGSASTPF